jgi:hypothetical protein
VSPFQTRPGLSLVARLSDVTSVTEQTELITVCQGEHRKARPSHREVRCISPSVPGMDAHCGRSPWAQPVEQDPSALDAPAGGGARGNLSPTFLSRHVTPARGWGRGGARKPQSLAVPFRGRTRSKLAFAPRWKLLLSSEGAWEGRGPLCTLICIFFFCWKKCLVTLQLLLAGQSPELEFRKNCCVNKKRVDQDKMFKCV